MKRIICVLACTFIVMSLMGQSPKKVLKKLGNNPVFFIDSINVDNTDLQKYDPREIAQVTVYKGKEAEALLGEDGKDGVVYIFTVKYCRNKYWNFFKSKSEEYSRIVKTPESDSAVQYILNKRVLTDDFEGDLFLIDDTTFNGIKFLDGETLEKEFKITGKKYGFHITSDVPANLYKGKKKF
ncbi:MAG: hypothetical protein QM668_00490 [Agriterribacter sp.]